MDTSDNRQDFEAGGAGVMRLPVAERGSTGAGGAAAHGSTDAPLCGAAHHEGDDFQGVIPEARSAVRDPHTDEDKLMSGSRLSACAPAGMTAVGGEAAAAASQRRRPPLLKGSGGRTKFSPEVWALV